MTDHSPRVSVSVAWIRSMLDEQREIDERMAKDAKRRAVLDEILEELKANMSFGEKLEVFGSASSGTVTIRERPAQPLTVSSPGQVTATWRSEVSRAYAEAGTRGLTLDELREELAKGPLGERLKRSDSGLYNATSILKGTGKIIKHGSRFYEAQAYTRLAHERGPGWEKEGMTESDGGGPPVSEARLVILDYVLRHDGVTSSEIRDALKDHSEVRPKLQRNPNFVSATLYRLVRGQEIERTAGGLYRSPNRNGGPESLGTKGSVVKGESDAGTSPSRFH